ncbi:unnamed protein product [Amoebophrya sp. A25]|nr:unnamed protein product [Amoebophrya sp. A25]|eukprot:GSA25T00007398001.1
MCQVVKNLDVLRRSFGWPAHNHRAKPPDGVPKLTIARPDQNQMNLLFSPRTAQRRRVLRERRKKAKWVWREQRLRAESERLREIKRAALQEEIYLAEEEGDHDAGNRRGRCRTHDRTTSDMLVDDDPRRHASRRLRQQQINCQRQQQEGTWKIKEIDYMQDSSDGGADFCDYEDENLLVNDEYCDVSEDAPSEVSSNTDLDGRGGLIHGGRGLHDQHRTRGGRSGKEQNDHDHFYSKKSSTTTSFGALACCSAKTRNALNEHEDDGASNSHSLLKEDEDFDDCRNSKSSIFRTTSRGGKTTRAANREDAAFVGLGGGAATSSSSSTTSYPSSRRMAGAEDRALGSSTSATSTRGGLFPTTSTSQASRIRDSSHDCGGRDQILRDDTSLLFDEEGPSPLHDRLWRFPFHSSTSVLSSINKVDEDPSSANKSSAGFYAPGGTTMASTASASTLTTFLPSFRFAGFKTGEFWLRGFIVGYIGDSGMDWGALTKGWIQFLAKDLLQLESGLFRSGVTVSPSSPSSTSAGCALWLMPDFAHRLMGNPDSQMRALYEFVGRFLAYSIYQLVQIEHPLALFLYKILLLSGKEFRETSIASPSCSRTSTTATSSLLWPTVNDALRDLETVDTEMAKGLEKIISWNEDRDGDLEDTLCLDFSIEMECIGERVFFPLKQCASASGTSAATGGDDHAHTSPPWSTSSGILASKDGGNDARGGPLTSTSTSSEDPPPVTFNNRVEYVYRVCQFHLLTSVQNSLTALRTGFHDVLEVQSVFAPFHLSTRTSSTSEVSSSTNVGGSSCSSEDNRKSHIFNHDYTVAAHRLRWLLEGRAGVSDTQIRELFSCVHVQGTSASLRASSKAEEQEHREAAERIKAMLKNVVLNGFAERERLSLLQFWLGRTRVPAAGFRSLYPRVTLAILGPKKHHKLPTAHVCFHRLDLPRYPTEQELGKKLRQAITLTGGAIALI